MANISVEGNTFLNVGTAVSYSVDSESIIDFKNNHLNGVKTAILERDAPSLVQSLGLPADTPVELVLETVRLLREKNISQPDEGAAYLKESKLWAYINRSSDAVSVISGLLALTSAAFGIPPAL